MVNEKLKAFGDEIFGDDEDEEYNEDISEDNYSRLIQEQLLDPRD